MQQIHAQLLRPPITVGRSNACGGAERALCFGLFGTHDALLFLDEMENEESRKIILICFAMWIGNSYQRNSII